MARKSRAKAKITKNEDFIGPVNQIMAMAEGATFDETVAPIEPETPITEAEAVIEAPVSEATLEDAVEMITALEGTTETVELTGTDVAVLNLTAETPSADLDTVMAQVTDEAVEAKLEATVKAIAERQDFEKVKDSGNAKIQNYLKGIHTAICTKRAARLMCATNVNPDILNRQIHEGTRYNVYAMGKLADVIKGLTCDDGGQLGKVSNAINLACMKSLFQFRAAGVPYTGEMAKASASDKIKITGIVATYLKRHTVSASTAPTQASSTMQALETLGVVTRTGSTKNPTFTLTDNPIVAKLETAIAA